MLTKTELKRIANERLEDAEALYNAGRLDGANYICGYVLEIALKLRICKTLGWADFPESRKEFEGLLSFKTHDLSLLLRLSGVEGKIKARHLGEWSTVVTWNSELRYNRVKSLNRTEKSERKVKVREILDATKTIFRAL